MARKAELIEKAKGLGLKVSEKNTIAEITDMLKEHEKALEKTSSQPKPEKKPNEQATAKAGKRSAKAIREAKAEEERLAKAEKAKEGEAESGEDAKKGPAPKPRPHIERRSKAYRNAVKDIDLYEEYEPSKAVELVIQTSTVKFDATVEAHIRLNVDPKQADQNIRETVTLPHGTGKAVRVAVFAAKDQHKAAKEAGADIVGEDDLLEKIKQGDINFDVLVSTPQLMGKLGQYAKILGPKGLMPNPKSGTVTEDIAGAVKVAKTGRMELRVDEQGIVHTSIGKTSFGAKKLLENYQAVIDTIAAAKPSSLKLNYIESITLSSSMGPGIRLQTQ